MKMYVRSEPVCQIMHGVDYIESIDACSIQIRLDSGILVRVLREDEVKSVGRLSRSRRLSSLEGYGIVSPANYEYE